MINWKVRFKNKAWVVSFISQVLLLLQIVFSALNSLDITHFQITGQINDTVMKVINIVFVILSMVGVVQDPTTKGLRDSERAMGYKDPN